MHCINHLELHGVTAGAVHLEAQGADTVLTFDGFDPATAAIRFEGAHPTLGDILFA